MVTQIAKWTSWIQAGSEELSVWRNPSSFPVTFGGSMVLWKKPRLWCQALIQILVQLLIACVVSSDLTKITQALKYHRLGGLNNRHLFLTDLKTGKSEIKVPANLRGLFLICRRPSYSCTLTWLRERGLWSFPLLIWVLIPSWGLHPHDFIQT